jgi:hypothetical protein
VSAVDDRMLCFGKEGFLRGITRKAERVVVPLYLILMGKKSEKHFKENELFLFFGSEEALTGSDRRFGRERPCEHFWAAKPHKHRGRSRPNRGFRLRSFFRPTVAQAGLRSGFTSARYRTQTAHFDQNTASVSVFWVQSMISLEEGENDGLDWG